MELYPSTSCLLWAQTILTQKRRPSARTSKGRHQTAAKRISHLRQVVKGSRVSPGEAADIAYLDALIGDEWKTAEALAGWLVAHASELPEMLTRANELAGRAGERSSEMGEDAECEDDMEHGGEADGSVDELGAEGMQGDFPSSSSVFDSVDMDVAIEPSVTCEPWNGMYASTSAPSAFPPAGMLQPFSPDDHLRPAFEMRLPITSEAAGLSSWFTSFYKSSNHTALPPLKLVDSFGAGAAAGLLPNAIPNAYTYGVCLHPKLPFKGSILPVCVSLQSGSGRLLTYMEASSDVIDSARAARHCYLYVLLPQLPKALITHHLEAKTLDLLLSVPYDFLVLSGTSMGLCFVLTMLSVAIKGQAMVPNVAMTGAIDLSGRVLVVSGIREKAIAAHRSGRRVLIIPKANEADLSGPWPKEDQGKVPAEVQNQWEEARAHLFFKVVERVEDAVNFLFPQLPKLQPPQRVGLDASIRVPLWLLGLAHTEGPSGGTSVIVEGFLVPGKGDLEAWGGASQATARSVDLAWRLIRDNVNELKAMAAAAPDQGSGKKLKPSLVWDPLSTRAIVHPVIHLANAPNVPVGIFTAGIFVVLASLATGRPVRRDVSIAAFVQANGELTGVPGGVEEAVELSSRLGIRELFTARTDVTPDITQAAQAVQMTVTGVRLVSELLSNAVFEDIQGNGP